MEQEGLILTREQDNSSVVFQPAESSVKDLQEEAEVKEAEVKESSQKFEIKKSDVSNLQRTKCEVFSRVVGYIRPVQQWNDGKVAEFGQRKTFEVAC